MVKYDWNPFSAGLYRLSCLQSKAPLSPSPHPLPLPSFYHVLMSTNGLCTKFSSSGYWARHNGDISSYDLKNVFLCRPSHVLLQVLQFPGQSLLHTSTFDFLVVNRKTDYCCIMTLLNHLRMQCQWKIFWKVTVHWKKGNTTIYLIIVVSLFSQIC